MTIIYRASDNTEFTTLEECQKYEKNLAIRNWASYIKGLSDEGNFVSYESTDFCSKVRMIHFKNYEGWNAFIKRAASENVATTGITAWNVIYFWDNEKARWEDVDETIENLRSSANHLNTLHTKITTTEEN